VREKRVIGPPQTQVGGGEKKSIELYRTFPQKPLAERVSERLFFGAETRLGVAMQPRP